MIFTGTLPAEQWGKETTPEITGPRLGERTPQHCSPLKRHPAAYIGIQKENSSQICDGIYCQNVLLGILYTCRKEFLIRCKTTHVGS